MLSNRDTARARLPGLWVSLVGPDGCGKSSVIEHLLKRLPLSLPNGVKLLYRRPGFVRVGFGRQGGPVIPHYSKPPHGFWASIVKLSIVAADWLVGWLTQILPELARGRLILLDRYYLLDVLIDPPRYRYGGPDWLAGLALRCLPAPQMVILLDAPVEVLQSRKQEVSPEESARQRAAYLRYARDLKACIVDASGSLENVSAQVESFILCRAELRENPAPVANF